MLIQMLRQEFEDDVAGAVVVVETTDDILTGIESVPDVAMDPVSPDVSGKISIVAIEIVQEMALLFAGDLNPVAPKAQRKVQLPDGLDLDAWINTPPPESSSSSEDEQTDLFVSNSATNDQHGSRRRSKIAEPTADELHKVRIERLCWKRNCF